MSMGIYYIKNIVNNKQYIGSAIDIDKRFKRHLKDLKKDTHHNILLQRSWNKYGEKSFEFGTVQLIENKSELLKIEQTYLDSLENLFNIAPACGGDLLTKNPNREQIIEKIKKSTIEYISKLTDDEKKEKWGRLGKDNGNYKDGLGGKKYCSTCKEVLIGKRDTNCQLCRDRTGENNPFYGKTHSKVFKEKKSKMQKEKFKNMTLEDKINHPNYRFVKIDGVIYSGLTVAAKTLKVSNGTICHRMKSKNSLYDDYHYIDDKDYLLENIDKIQELNIN